MKKMMKGEPGLIESFNKKGGGGTEERKLGSGVKEGKGGGRGGIRNNPATPTAVEVVRRERVQRVLLSMVREKQPLKKKENRQSCHSLL